MSNTAKVLLTSLPFLLMGIYVLFLPKCRERRAAQMLESLESMPLKSKISVSGELMTSSRHTFSIGDYGVTDLGNVRLVFADLPFTGSSSSGVTLSTDSDSRGPGGSSGVGNRRFETDNIPHGSRCRFGGVTFEIVKGKLTLGDTVVDTTGQPTLVLVGADRDVVELRPLKVP